MRHTVVRPELVLVPRLCCPRCAALHWNAFQRPGVDVIHKCGKTSCRQHWWAMVLEEGPVFEQLVWTFEDTAIAEQLTVTYRLPATLDIPHYWQLPLTGNEAHHHHRLAPRALFNALGWLRVIR